jgi:outer membrane protein assembly factor BamA
LGISWNLRFYDFFNVDIDAYAPEKAPPGLGFIDPTGPYRLAYMAQFAKFHWVDSPKDSRSGFSAELRLEEGAFFFGGEFDYLKLQPDLRGYIPLGTKRLVLALRATFAYLHPFGDQNSPVTQRIGFGGPNNHRGFTYGRLSPQARVASGEWVPQGGNVAVLFSSDLRLRIWKLFGGWISLAAFFDAGDAVPQLGDLSFDQLHLAVGGSLSYQTPIGAIRFGIGVRLNRLAEAEDDGRTNPDPGDRLAYHLSIGQAF